MSSSEPIAPHARAGSPTRTPLVSLVAPVYCEEELIEEFYARVKAMLAGLAPKYDHEIVLVNDGSTDRTLEILKGLAERDPHLRVASFSRNFGHQMAITAGIDLAAGDAVVIIDSDLQDPPEVVPRMIAKWEEGFKVVYGVRSERQARAVSNWPPPACSIASCSGSPTPGCRGTPAISASSTARWSRSSSRCGKSIATCGA